MGKASRTRNQQVQKVSPQKAPAFAGSLIQSSIVLLLLSILAILIYSNTFSVSFEWDDTPNILANPRIRNWSSILLSESRYVAYFSFALNYYFGGFDVIGFHLVNFLIHISNGFLVYMLVLLLFKTPRMQPSPPDSNQSFLVASATALLFVAHPIQTQAVTYIVQRITSLATFFYLLAVVLYLKWRLAPSEARGRYLWYAGAWLATVLAMKTKEITFTLPFMLLLVEVVFLVAPTRRARWIALIPFFLTLPIIPLSSLPEVFYGNEQYHFAAETTDISRVDYLLTQFTVIVIYLRLLILPIDQNLDYDYPVYHSLLQPKVFLSFLFLSALVGLAFYFLVFSHRSARPNLFKLVGFGLLWFFLTLSVESSIIPITDVIFEHRLYLPSIGFFMATSMALLTFDRTRRMNTIVIGVIIVAFSIAAYQRNLVWKDELTLWSDVVQKSPFKIRGRNNLAEAYQRLGQYYEAMQEYKSIITLDPKNARAHIGLGVAYYRVGSHDEAIQEYKSALAFDPNSAIAHFNLGSAYKEVGRMAEAIPEFQIALKLEPDLFQAHYYLGQIYQRMGRVQDAIREFEQTLQIRPDYDPARQALKSLRQ